MGEKDGRSKLRTTQGTRECWGSGRRAGTAGGTPGPGELPSLPSHEGYVFILIHDPVYSCTNAERDAVKVQWDAITQQPRPDEAAWMFC